MDKQDIYKYVEIDASGCWNWTRAKDRKGYGVLNIPYRIYAHRLSYELSTGQSARGKSVCHRCDNPACINPEHLWLGSHAENMADMKAKGRNANPPVHSGATHWRYKYPEKIQRGQDQANSKITDEQVIRMRRDYISGVKKPEIAAANGMTLASVSDVLLGRSWKHLLGVNGAPTLEDLKAYAKLSQKSAAKINAEIAAEIRRRLALGENGRLLAAEFGIHKATVHDIKHRKIWAD